MPLSVRKRSGKEYIYFVMGASKRLYLGTSDKPKKERIGEAILYLRSRIKEQEDELWKLESLASAGIKQPEASSITEKVKYKLVVFDVDGVIYEKPWHETSNDNVAISTWDVLFQELGIYNIHEKLKQDYINGTFKSYMDWTEAACNVLKSVHLDRKTFQNIINRRQFSPGAKELFQKLHENKIITALATGSFEDLAQRANEELGGVDYILAHCKLNFSSEGLLENWKLQTIDYKDKADFVKKIRTENDIPIEKCAYVGDDVNDLDAFKEVGLAIAFNSKKRVVQQAVDVVIDGMDLAAILPHLYEPEKGVSRRKAQ